MMVSFNLGQKAHFNDGITSALILFGSVFILILSYIFYRDKISVIETFGITVIICGVVVISVFKAADHSQTIIDASSPAEDVSWEKLGCIGASK